MLDLKSQYQAGLENQRKEHAAEIIDLLEDLTSGNLQECLDVARCRNEFAGNDLWTAIIENLQVMLRQAEQIPTRRQEYDCLEPDDIPF